MTRTEWFERGHKALLQHAPEAPGYGCPMCLRAAPVPEAFTIEDVPPASVGGKPLVLTCRECNSKAGYEIDVHVHKGQMPRSFLRGEDMKAAKDFGLRIGDATVPVGLATSEGAVSLIGHPRAGAPEDRDAVTERFREAVTEGLTDWEFHLDFPAYSQKKERVGWLRAAYLVAFAKLGYAYILRPELRVVRKQLWNPDDEEISGYLSWDLQSPSDARRLLLVERPPEMRSLAVRMGQATILLPDVVGENDIYARLRASKVAKPSQVYGAQMPWPVGPEFHLDFARGGSARG